MSTAVISRRSESVADVLHKLGDVPLSRLRFHPYPATEADVIAIRDHEDRLVELLDGFLVEKAMGVRESFLAILLAGLLNDFVRPRKLGIVLGADGTLKLAEGSVRIPDVSFISWKDIPGGKLQKGPIPKLAPTLAAEVLSESNTEAEIKRKRKEFFKAGTSLMWIVDPKARTVAL